HAAGGDAGDLPRGRPHARRQAAAAEDRAARLRDRYRAGSGVPRAAVRGAGRGELRSRARGPVAAAGARPERGSATSVADVAAGRRDAIRSLESGSTADPAMEALRPRRRAGREAGLAGALVRARVRALHAAASRAPREGAVALRRGDGAHWTPDSGDTGGARVRRDPESGQRL